MRTLFTLVCTIVSMLYAFTQEGIYRFNPETVPDSVFPQFIDQNPEFYPSGGYTGEGKWSEDFAVPGIVGNIYATATDGTNFYIGGNFTAAGSTLANSIAMWDGSRWHSIGEGPENGVSGDIPSVEAMAFADGKLFVGGQFSKAGSMEVNGLAYWDGTRWHRMGSDSTNGVRRHIAFDHDTLTYRGYVAALLAHNNKIYVGGNFQFAGDSIADGIASWNVTSLTWETQDHGLDKMKNHSRATVFCLAAFENNIYIGGTFQFLADGIPTRNIARWNGTTWTSMGEAAGYVLDMKTDVTGKLYASGFYDAEIEKKGGASGIGIWDGNSWSGLNGPGDYRSSVARILFYNNELYASGSFSQDHIDPDKNLAKWDGAGWEIIDGLGQTWNNQFTAGIRAMQVAGGKFFVAGNFTRAGNKYAVNVAEWDIAGSAWKLLDDGNANQGIHDGRILAMDQKGDTIYAGGDFTIAGSTFARGIAKWTGKEWESLGTGTGDLNGIRGLVYAILADTNSNNVYAGGYFDQAGGEAAFHIARWDGTRWRPMGIGVGGVPGAHVRALAKVNDYLYVGGYFTVVGDEENYEMPANSLARFNLKTNRWETLGRGIEYLYGKPGTVHDLEVHGDKIYVGGVFYNADGAFYENFAVLKGNKWSGLDDVNNIGIKGTVRKIKTFHDEIYIGGLLKKEKKGASYGMMKWDGDEWAPAGDSLTAGENEVFVNDIVEFDSGLVAGGLFTMAGDLPVNNMAYFDGRNWSAIGGGVFPGISRLAATEYKLYTAGPVQIFTGDGLSMGISELDFTPEVISDLPQSDKEPDRFTIYPNPFRTTATVSFTVETPGHVQVAIFDQQGREIQSLLNEHRPTGDYSLTVDAGSLPGGVYFCRLTNGNSAVTKKMLIAW